MARSYFETCDCKELVGLASCLRDPCVNPSQRQAVQIVLLNFIIAGLNNGEVYTLAELLALGKCCQCNISDLDRDAIWTYLLWQLAEAVGEGAPITPGTLIEEACRLACSGQDRSDILTALNCLFLKAVYTATEEPIQ